MRLPSNTFSPTSLAVYLVLASSIIGAIFMKLSIFDLPPARAISIEQSAIDDPNRLGFSAPKWQAQGQYCHESRLYLFKEFMNEFGLIGLRREQVLQLLGPPIDHRSNLLITKVSGKIHGDIDSYWLESSHSLTGSKVCHLLYVNGVVARFSIDLGPEISDNFAEWLSSDN